MPGVTVTTNTSFSTSSSEEDYEEIPTRKFGKESLDKIVVENENLVFDGTVVKHAKTLVCIEAKNGAKIDNANAGFMINAEGCPALGQLSAGGTIQLSKCSAGHCNAGGKIVAKDCENVGNLNAGGKIELTHCSFGNASAGGQVEADGCQNFGKISAGGKVEIKNSTVNRVSAGGQVDVRKTTIKEKLDFSQDSTIADSKVHSIVVHPHVSSCVTTVNGRVVKSSMGRRATNIYLENSIVENIQFVGRGKVFLRGNSEIRGKVVNGEVVKCPAIKAKL